MSTVNDSLVFLAISLKLMSNNSPDKSFTGRFKTFFRGNGMTSISKALFKGGQIYYLYVTALVLGVCFITLCHLQDNRWHEFAHAHHGADSQRTSSIQVRLPDYH